MSNIDLYDKDHSAFRKKLFELLINRQKEKFVNRFRFEGDENFGKKTQRLFFRYVFEYGYASITDLSIIQKEQFKKTETYKFLSGNTKVDVLLNKMFKVKKIALIAQPYQYDSDENIVRATGVDSPLSNIRKIAMGIDMTNSVFMRYGEIDMLTGKQFWEIFAYMYSTVMTTLKKKLQLADPKMISNIVNNDVLNSISKKMFDISSDVIPITASSNSITDRNGQKSNKVDIREMLISGSDIKKLDMANVENIENIVLALQAISNEFNRIVGERVNTSIKSERNINADFIADELHFRLLEKQHREYIDDFVEKYKELFGIQLRVVDLKEEIANEMQDNFNKEAEKDNKEEVNLKGETKNANKNNTTKNI